MRGNSALKGAILGLVVERPGHGYDLAVRLSRRMGPAWGIQAKAVYPMLGQLERAGLVAPKEPVRDGRRSGHVVYLATNETEDALSAWMAEPVSQKHVRAELQAKVAVSRPQDAPRLLRALDAYEQQCFYELRENSATEVGRVSWTGVVINLARAGVDAHLRAEVDWVRAARREIEEFLAVQRQSR